MEVDEPTSPARVVALSPQGSEDTKSSSSSPTQGADGEGPVLRLREAVHEPSRGRSPQVVVRRYQGARNQQEIDREGARTSTVLPSRWSFLGHLQMLA